MTDEAEAEPTPESEPVPPPVDYVDVVSRGGKPPMAPPAVMDAGEWAASLGPGARIAGFLHSMSEKDPSRRTPSEWAKAMAEFKATPVKR